VRSIVGGGINVLVGREWHRRGCVGAGRRHDGIGGR
jgi:hypothetical protein